MYSKDENLYMAKKSEQAERYEEMTKYMTEIAVSDVELSVEERNLLSVAFKNLIGSKRVSWRVLHSIELKEKTRQSEEKLAIVLEYKAKIETEMKTICQNVFRLLDDYLIKNATSGESKVFFHKMKGDYYRYMTEFSKDRKEAADNSLTAYKFATDIATTELAPTHPIRLGLALNFSVFYFEITNDSVKACQLAKQAFDDAITELDSLPEDVYKDSTLILQLLRDNLTLWRTDVPPAEVKMPRLRLTTPILKYALESEEIDLPIKYGPVQLNKIVKNLLKKQGIATKNVKFNFFINEELINCPLNNFLKLKGISEEIEEIVYEVDIKPPKLVNETELEEYVFGMKFKSKWLICCNYGMQILDSTVPEKPVVSITHDDYYDMTKAEWISLDENSNEAVIIAAGFRGQMFSWKCDLINGTYSQQFIYKGHMSDITDLRHSSSRGLIASGCWDGMLKIWSTSQELTDLSAETGGIPHKSKNVNKTPIKIPLVTLQAHSRNLYSIRWIDRELDTSDKSICGNLVTTGESYCITLWNIDGCQSTALRHFKLPSAFSTMEQNQHNQCILICCSDHRMRYYDFSSTNPEIINIERAEDERIVYIKWNPVKSNIFVTCNFDFVLKLWEASNMRSAKSIIYKHSKDFDCCSCCEWSEDGELLVAAFDGIVKFFRFD